MRERMAHALGLSISFLEYKLPISKVRHYLIAEERLYKPSIRFAKDASLSNVLTTGIISLIERQNTLDEHMDTL